MAGKALPRGAGGEGREAADQGLDQSACGGQACAGFEDISEASGTERAGTVAGRRANAGGCGRRPAVLRCYPGYISAAFDYGFPV
jgi:hypothetical protein